MSVVPKQHGLTEKDEAHSRKLLADTRTTSEKIFSFFGSRPGLIIFLLTCAILSVLFTSFAFVFVLTGLVFFLVSLGDQKLWHPALPFKLPLDAKVTDYNDPLPGRHSFRQSCGVVPIGNAWPEVNEGKWGKELWMSLHDVLTHMLVLGTTGSGKTEFLVGFLFAAGLATASGGAYIDPKGDIKLAAQIFVLCRLLGRDDDFRLLNYNTGAKQGGGRNSCERISNDTNPLATGNAEDIAQTLNSMLPEPDGPNAVFAQSAHQLGSALVYALVDLREAGQPVSIMTMREYMEADRFAMLSMDERLSETARIAMRAFMTSVQWRDDSMKPIIEARIRAEKARQNGGRALDVPPAGQKGPSAADEAALLDPYYQQFGYAKSYFGLVLGSLVDTYGYIYRPPRPEIEIADVIMQSRIFVALMPALTKSPTEVKNIGKVSLSMFRNAIGAGLGSKAKGTLDDVIYSRPSAAVRPFPLITDEYAAIATEGFEIVMTQARSLGIAAAIGNQDYAGLTKAGDKGEASAKQIVSNTNLRMAMKLNDPQETWKLLEDMAGETEVAKVGGYQRTNDDTGHFSKMANVSVLSKSRIDKRDLQEQIEGEFHAFFRGRICRGQSFYTDVPLKKHFSIHIHEMLKVMPPDMGHLQRVHGIPRTIGQRLAEYADRDGPFQSAEMAEAERFTRVVRDPGSLSTNESSIAGVLAMIESVEEAMAKVRQDALTAKQANMAAVNSVPSPADPVKGATPVKPVAAPTPTQTPAPQDVEAPGAPEGSDNLKDRPTTTDFFDLDSARGKAEDSGHDTHEASVPSPPAPRSPESEDKGSKDEYPDTVIDDDDDDIFGGGDSGGTRVAEKPEIAEESGGSSQASKSADEKTTGATPDSRVLDEPRVVEPSDSQSDGSGEQQVDDDDSDEENGAGGFDGLPPAAGPVRARRSVSPEGVGRATERALGRIHDNFLEDMAQIAMALGTPTSEAIEQAQELEERLARAVDYPLEPVPEVTEEAQRKADESVEKLLKVVRERRKKGDADR